jgi:hypothetical protein
MSTDELTPELIPIHSISSVKGPGTRVSHIVPSPPLKLNVYKQGLETREKPISIQMLNNDRKQIVVSVRNEDIKKFMTIGGGKSMKNYKLQ